MSPIYVKEGVNALGVAIHGVSKEFVFPYSTEDPEEQAALLANGAVVEVPELIPAPPKKSIKEVEGGEL